MLPFAGVIKWASQELPRTTRQRVFVLLLVALCIVAYAPFLANPYVFDDHNLFGKISFIDYTFQFTLAPRWLPYATLAHTQVMLDGSITAMRVGNLFLHAVNAVLVFVLLHELCLATSAGEDARRENLHALVVATVGAALLAVHPVAVYAVGYVAQRTILMSTLFMLLMLIAYLRWLRSGRTSLWVWSAIWYFLSVFSKEHSVAAPALAFLLTLVVQRPSIAVFRRLIAPFATYTAIALLVVSMVKGVLGVAYEPYALEMIKEAQDAGGADTLAYPLSVFTQTYLFFKYMFLWVIPNVRWMSLDMREPLATSLLAWPYLAALLGATCYTVAALGMVLRGGRIGLVGWLLLYPWIMFLTELSTIRVQEPFVLYRSYLWFPLFGALLPLALLRLNVKAIAALMVPILCLLVALSWNRLQSLSDTFLTWNDAAKLLVTGKEAGAGRIYFNRALALSAKGQKHEALVDMDRALELNPKLAPIHFAKAQVNFELQRYAEALKNLNQTIALNPLQANAFFARFVTLKRLGREVEALGDLRTSCEMKDFMGCYVLGQQTKDTAPKP